MDWPRPFHPMTIREVPTEQGGTTFVEDVDESVTVQAFQLRPDTWTTLATWCGGLQCIVAGSQAVAIGTLDNLVSLGGFVIERDGEFVIADSDGTHGFYQRYQAASTVEPEPAENGE